MDNNMEPLDIDRVRAGGRRAGHCVVGLKGLTMVTTKEEATEFFSILFRGKHHIPSPLKSFGEGWSTLYDGEAATYDFDLMTRIVLLSHDKHIRASIHGKSRHRIEIVVWKRDRTHDQRWGHHPTMEEALKAWRKTHKCPKAQPPNN